MVTKKKKIEIVPAILEKNFKKLERKVTKADDANARLVQIDICDGQLTPDKTFASSGRCGSFKNIKNISPAMRYEIDMIVDFTNSSEKKKDAFFHSLSYLQPARIIFHNRGVENWDEIFQWNKKTKSKIALGIWLDDDVKHINTLLEKYSFAYIQIMGIERVGYGGQTLSEKVFKRAKYFSEKYPNIPVQIDGGVKKENAKKLAKNGVTQFVAGSGIYGSDDIKKRITEFKQEVKD